MILQRVSQLMHAAATLPPRALVEAVPTSSAAPIVASLRNGIGREGAAVAQAHEGVNQLLQSGTTGPVLRTLGGSSNVNGALPVRTVTDSAGTAVDAVFKPKRGGEAATEMFAHDVAAAIGMERLLPSMARRAGSGDVAMEVVPGEMLGHQLILGGAGLERGLTRAYTDSVEGATKAVAARQARMDTELMQAFDYVTANGDRHAGNAMLDPYTGKFTLIDHGLIGRERALDDGLTPRLREHYLRDVAKPLDEDVYTIKLSDDVRDMFASADRTKIRAAFERLQPEAPNASRMRRAKLDETYLSQLEARLDHIAATGSIQFAYRP